LDESSDDNAHAFMDFDDEEPKVIKRSKKATNALVDVSLD
jgi:hypothetical protein